VNASQANSPESCSPRRQFVLVGQQAGQSFVARRDVPVGK
jgi:hypothetical protein